MNVLILDDYQHGILALPCMARLAGHQVTVFDRPIAEMPGAGAVLAAADAVIPMRERTRLDEAVLAQMPRLKHIAQTGKAGKHIDLQACKRRGITVSEGAGTAYAAAELAFLLVMAGLRNLVQEVAGLKDGHFGISFGRTLRGRTLGIVGYGKAGTLVARFASGFGMQVLVYGSEASMARATADGFTAVPDRTAFFTACDAVSLHLRLTPETRGFIGEADLQQMKKDSLLVNTARAEIINQPALLRALERNRPGLYAADVFMQEPPTLQSDPVIALKNVLATPHIGYLDVDSFDLMVGSSIDNLLAFDAGKAQNLLAF
ncbi:MAG: D-2-hydroxyacid dehydrogenase family protein [Pseudomonadota bacterium]